MRLDKRAARFGQPYWRNHPHEHALYIIRKVGGITALRDAMTVITAASRRLVEHLRRNDAELRS